MVFLIGMRINNPLLMHKWLPVARAMPRTILQVQYWRSMDQLLAYATNRNAAHLPAWRAFNTPVGTDGSVGIWHETYAASPRTCENVYVNMPPLGLGKAGMLHPATGGRQSATGRLSADDHAR